MATILTQYLEKREALHKVLTEGKLPLTDILTIQELDYRISVLRAMQTFCMSAPVTMDVRQIGYHYQLVDSYMSFLLSERKFGPKTDENGMRRRETAAAALGSVMDDHRRRFGSFKCSGPELYRSSIGNMVNTVLPAWIQYRNTYINL